MELKNITNKNLVFSKQLINTKEEAIKFLVKKLYDEGKLTSYEEYLEAVMHRETLSPTGFEGGLAIPHGKSKAVKEAAFAVMTLENPIEDWESIDPDNRVELVFLIAVPESEGGSTHLEILSELVTRLADENYKNNLLNSKTQLELFNNLDPVQEKEAVEEEALNSENEENVCKKTILAITACPAGIAHTYMAAEALMKAGKKMGVDIHVEKQGANGIVDPHTPELIQKAEAIIYATDVAPKNTERFKNLPSIKTPVAAPLKRAEQIIQQALEAGEKNDKGAYEEVATTSEPQEEKSNWKSDVKGAVLTGVSHIVPLIVGGGMILAFAVLATQIFGLQELYNLEGSWLWQYRKLSGGLIGTVLNPILAGYIAYSLAEKPGLGPGIAAGLSADLIGAGFLGAMVGGLLAGYFLRFLKKRVPAQGTFAGFISFWLYPVVGAFVVGTLMLFVVGKPVAAMNNGLINWLNGLSGASSIILGAIIAGMVSFDLGGPVNKAAYTFAIGAISSGNYIPYAILASTKMVSAFGVTIATTIGKDIFTKEEKEIGMQTWILGLAGITEGAIPFMLEDPARVIPSLVGGSVVTGAIVGYFNLGLQVPGAGIFSLALLEKSSNISSILAATIWFGAAVIGAIIAAALLIITRKQKLAKEELNSLQKAI